MLRQTFEKLELEQIVQIIQIHPVKNAIVRLTKEVSPWTWMILRVCLQMTPSILSLDLDIWGYLVQTPRYPM